MVRSMTGTFLGLAVAVLTSSAALAAGPFDGAYVGPLKQTTGETLPRCQNISRPRATVVIKDNVASIPWGQTVVTAPVQPDGSFDGHVRGGFASDFFLKGKIAGTGLEADVGTAMCNGHLSLSKS